MLELEKLRQRVDEFNEYGELDMMGQYVQDIRAVQKRLADAQESIAWLNKEEVTTKTIHKISNYACGMSTQWLFGESKLSHCCEL